MPEIKAEGWLLQCDFNQLVEIKRIECLGEMRLCSMRSAMQGWLLCHVRSKRRKQDMSLFSIALTSAQDWALREERTFLAYGLTTESLRTATGRTSLPFVGHTLKDCKASSQQCTQRLLSLYVWALEDALRPNHRWGYLTGRGINHL